MGCFPIRPTTRERIYQRDQYVCAHCGEWMGNADRRMLTLDHVITREEHRRQGLKFDNTARNLVLACLPCNSARGSKTLTLLSLTVQARIGRRLATPLPALLQRPAA